VPQFICGALDYAKKWHLIAYCKEDKEKVIIVTTAPTTSKVYDPEE
jgi:tRNA A37 threonylcarbamoyladenosine dehydratase